MSNGRVQGRLWRALCGGGILSFFLICQAATLLPEEKVERLYGVLQGTLAHAEEGYQRGWRVAVLPLAWEAFEPKPGEVDEAYVRSMREKAKAFRKAGYKLQLDLGMQYPPAWIFQLPHARYRNQHGADYESNDPGRRMPNYVFNQAVRDRLRLYLEKVFEHLGADWEWVRLGGGFYGEVNYPPHAYQGKKNCYWGFDPVAQGKAGELPEGVKACPVREWVPGLASEEHASARQFAEWYLESLRNYHDWQIATVRKSYQGDICMMYGSWGMRPGWLEQAVAGDLAGLSKAEQGGEIATGYDWSRMISGIRDGRVIVYCTWLDAPPKHCDDEGADPVKWSPVHWQASLAKAHPLKLRIWGENTGRGDRAAMQTTFERMKRYGLMGILWAFESDLFEEKKTSGTATFSEYAEFIRDFR